MQALQEYYVTTTRWLRPGLDPEDARADVVDLMAWRPVQHDAQALASAWAIDDRLSFWDALIVASADVAGCETLLTEDLQHGMDLGGVRIVETFQVAPANLA